MLELVTRHRFLLQNLVQRDLRIKYRGTLFGYLWTLLEPLSMVLIYDFVFRVILKRGDESYPLLLMLGILPYNYVAGVVQSGATALVSNASLIRRAPLPRAVFVVSVASSQLIILLLSMLAIIPFLIAYQVTPGFRLLLVPVPLLFLASLATGTALIAACAQVVFRDVGYVLRVATRLLFYLSPVIYQVSDVPDRLRAVYLLNPIAVPLTMVRNWVMDRPLEVEAPWVMVSAAISLTMLVLGAATFRALDRRIVKYL